MKMNADVQSLVDYINTEIGEETGKFSAEQIKQATKEIVDDFTFFSARGGEARDFDPLASRGQVQGDLKPRDEDDAAFSNSLRQNKAVMPRTAKQFIASYLKGNRPTKLSKTAIDAYGGTIGELLPYMNDESGMMVYLQGADTPPEAQRRLRVAKDIKAIHDPNHPQHFKFEKILEDPESSRLWPTLEPEVQAVLSNMGNDQKAQLLQSAANKRERTKIQRQRIKPDHDPRGEGFLETGFVSTMLDWGQAVPGVTESTLQTGGVVSRSLKGTADALYGADRLDAKFYEDAVGRAMAATERGELPSDEDRNTIAKYEERRDELSYQTELNPYKQTTSQALGSVVQMMSEYALVKGVAGKAAGALSTFPRMATLLSSGSLASKNLLKAASAAKVAGSTNKASALIGLSNATKAATDVGVQLAVRAPITATQMFYEDRASVHQHNLRNPDDRKILADEFGPAHEHYGRTLASAGIELGIEYAGGYATSRLLQPAKKLSKSAMGAIAKSRWGKGLATGITKTSGFGKQLTKAGISGPVTEYGEEIATEAALFNLGLGDTMPISTDLGLWVGGVGDLSDMDDERSKARRRSLGLLTGVSVFGGGSSALGAARRTLSREWSQDRRQALRSDVYSGKMSRKNYKRLVPNGKAENETERFQDVMASPDARNKLKQMNVIPVHLERQINQLEGDIRLWHMANPEDGTSSTIGIPEGYSLTAADVMEKEAGGVPTAPIRGDHNLTEEQVQWKKRRLDALRKLLPPGKRQPVEVIPIIRPFRRGPKGQTNTSGAPEMELAWVSEPRQKDLSRPELREAASHGYVNQDSDTVSEINYPDTEEDGDEAGWSLWKGTTPPTSDDLESTSEDGYEFVRWKADKSVLAARNALKKRDITPPGRRLTEDRDTYLKKLHLIERNSQASEEAFARALATDSPNLAAALIDIGPENLDEALDFLIGTPGTFAENTAGRALQELVIENGLMGDRELLGRVVTNLRKQSGKSEHSVKKGAQVHYRLLGQEGDPAAAWVPGKVTSIRKDGSVRIKVGKQTFTAQPGEFVTAAPKRGDQGTVDGQPVTFEEDAADGERYVVDTGVGHITVDKGSFVSTPLLELGAEEDAGPVETEQTAAAPQPGFEATTQTVGTEPVDITLQPGEAQADPTERFVAEDGEDVIDRSAEAVTTEPVAEEAPVEESVEPSLEPITSEEERQAYDAALKDPEFAVGYAKQYPEEARKIAAHSEYTPRVFSSIDPGLSDAVQTSVEVRLAFKNNLRAALLSTPGGGIAIDSELSAAALVGPLSVLHSDGEWHEVSPTWELAPDIERRTVGYRAFAKLSPGTESAQNAEPVAPDETTESTTRAIRPLKKITLTEQQPKTRRAPRMLPASEQLLDSLKKVRENIGRSPGQNQTSGSPVDEAVETAVETVEEPAAEGQTRPVRTPAPAEEPAAEDAALTKDRVSMLVRVAVNNGEKVALNLAFKMNYPAPELAFLTSIIKTLKIKRQAQRDYEPNSDDIAAALDAAATAAQAIDGNAPAYTHEALIPAWLNTNTAEDRAYLERHGHDARARRLAKRLRKAGSTWKTARELTVKHRDGTDGSVQNTSRRLREFLATGLVRMVWDSEGMPRYSWADESIPGDYFSDPLDVPHVASVRPVRTDVPAEETAAEDVAETPAPKARAPKPGTKSTLATEILELVSSVHEGRDPKAASTIKTGTQSELKAIRDALRDGTPLTPEQDRAIFRKPAAEPEVDPVDEMTVRAREIDELLNGPNQYSDEKIKELTEERDKLWKNIGRSAAPDQTSPQTGAGGNREALSGETVILTETETARATEQRSVSAVTFGLGRADLENMSDSEFKDVVKTLLAGRRDFPADFASAAYEILADRKGVGRSTDTAGRRAIQQAAIEDILTRLGKHSDMALPPGGISINQYWINPLDGTVYRVDKLDTESVTLKAVEGDQTQVLTTDNGSLEYQLVNQYRHRTNWELRPEDANKEFVRLEEEFVQQLEKHDNTAGDAKEKAHYVTSVLRRFATGRRGQAFALQRLKAIVGGRGTAEDIAAIKPNNLIVVPDDFLIKRMRDLEAGDTGNYGGEQHDNWESVQRAFPQANETFISDITLDLNSISLNDAVGIGIDPMGDKIFSGLQSDRGFESGALGQLRKVISQNLESIVATFSKDSDNTKPVLNELIVTLLKAQDPVRGTDKLIKIMEEHKTALQATLSTHQPPALSNVFTISHDKGLPPHLEEILSQYGESTFDAYWNLVNNLTKSRTLVSTGEYFEGYSVPEAQAFIANKVLIPRGMNIIAVTNPDGSKTFNVLDGIIREDKVLYQAADSEIYTAHELNTLTSGDFTESARKEKDKIRKAHVKKSDVTGLGKEERKRLKGQLKKEKAKKKELEKRYKSTKAKPRSAHKQSLVNKVDARIAEIRAEIEDSPDKWVRQWETTEAIQKAELKAVDDKWKNFQEQKKAHNTARLPDVDELLLPHAATENTLKELFETTASPTSKQLAQVPGALVTPEGRDRHGHLFSKVLYRSKSGQKVEPTSYEDLRGMLEWALDEGVDLDWYSKFGEQTRKLVGDANIKEFAVIFGVTSAKKAAEQNFAETLHIMDLARRFDPRTKPDKFRRALQVPEKGKKDHRIPRPDLTGGKAPFVVITGSQIQTILDYYNTAKYAGGLKVSSYMWNIVDKSGNDLSPFSVQDVHMSRVFGFKNRRRYLYTAIEDGKTVEVSFSKWEEAEQEAQDTKTKNPITKSIVDGAIFDNPKQIRYAMYMTSMLAAEYGLTPQQAQAALWFYAKKKLSPKVEEKVEEEDGKKGVKKKVGEGTFASAMEAASEGVSRIRSMVASGEFDTTAPRYKGMDTEPSPYRNRVPGETALTKEVRDLKEEIAAAKKADQPALKKKLKETVAKLQKKIQAGWSNLNMRDRLTEIALERAPQALISFNPGEGRGFGLPSNLTLEELVEFQQHMLDTITDDNGQIRILSELRIPHTVTATLGTFSRMEPSFLLTLPGSDMATTNMIANLLGDAMLQDAAIALKMDDSKAKWVGVVSKKDDSEYSQDELEKVYTHVNPNHDERGINFTLSSDKKDLMIFDDGGMASVGYDDSQYTDEMSAAFQTKLNTIMSGGPVDYVAGMAGAVSNYYESETTDDKTGRTETYQGRAEYFARLSGSPSRSSHLLARANDLLYTPAWEGYQQYLKDKGYPGPTTGPKIARPRVPSVLMSRRTKLKEDTSHIVVDGAQLPDSEDYLALRSIESHLAPTEAALDKLDAVRAHTATISNIDPKNLDDIVLRVARSLREDGTVFLSTASDATTTDEFFQSVGESRNSDNLGTLYSDPDSEQRLRDYLNSKYAHKVHKNRGKGPFTLENKETVSSLEGQRVGLRIDIPFFNTTSGQGNPQYAITIHDGSKQSIGSPIGYDSIARLTGDVLFESKELPAGYIHRGFKKSGEKQTKTPVATVEGSYTNDRTIPEDLDTNWTAVGYDPHKAVFFYDKITGQEVTSGTDAVSVGNTVFTRNPVYGKRSAIDETRNQELHDHRQKENADAVEILSRHFKDVEVTGTVITASNPDVHDFHILETLDDRTRELLEGPGDQTLTQHRVWHGSPHRFDRFTLEHMLSGEGAHAFGWGLYFTDTKAIAKQYRDKLVETQIDGLPVDEFYDQNFTASGTPAAAMLLAHANAVAKAAGQGLPLPVVEDFEVAVWPRGRFPAEVAAFYKQELGRVVPVEEALEMYDNDPRVMDKEIVDLLQWHGNVEAVEEYLLRQPTAADLGPIPPELGSVAASRLSPAKVLQHLYQMQEDGRLTSAEGGLYEVDLMPDQSDYLLWHRTLDVHAVPTFESDEAIKLRRQGFLQETGDPVALKTEELPRVLAIKRIISTIQQVLPRHHKFPAPRVDKFTGEVESEQDNLDRIMQSATGQDLYEGLQDALKESGSIEDSELQRKASEVLLGNGIPGIMYPDGFTNDQSKMRSKIRLADGVSAEKYNIHPPSNAGPLAGRPLGVEHVAKFAFNLAIEPGSIAPTVGRMIKVLEAQIRDMEGEGVESSATPRIYKQTIEALKAGDIFVPVESHNYVIFSGADIAINELYQAQPGDMRAGEPQAAYGAFVPKLETHKKVIALFEGGNLSTLLHELGHYFRSELTESENRTLERIMLASQAGKDGKFRERNGRMMWDRAAEEYFAQEFQKYTRDGNTEVPGLTTAFQRFKDWITGTLLHLPDGVSHKLNPEMRTFFDSMLSGKDRSQLAESISKDQNLQQKLARSEPLPDIPPVPVAREVLGLISKMQGWDDEIKTPTWGTKLAGFFRSRGMLPKPIWHELQKHKNRMAAAERRVAFAQTDFKKAVKKNWGTMDARNNALVNDFLSDADEDIRRKARESLEEAAPAVLKAAEAFRDTVKEMSRVLLDEGAVPKGKLEASVNERMEFYMHTAYKFYEEKETWTSRYVRDNHPDVWIEAQDWLREMNSSDVALGLVLVKHKGRSLRATREEEHDDGTVTVKFLTNNTERVPVSAISELSPKSERQIDEDINDLLTHHNGPGFPIASILGAKELGILKKKNDLPEPLRHLWGEYTNVDQRMPLTLLKMNRLISEHTFLTNLRTLGLGKFFFEKHTQPIPDSTEIVAKDNPKFAPLDGLYAEDWVLKELQTHYDPRPAEGTRAVVNAAVDWYKRILAGVKIGKTAYSKGGEVKNFTSNILTAIASGNWSPRALWEMGGAIKTIIDDWTSTPKDEQRKYLDTLYELGVVDSGVNRQDLLVDLDRASNSKMGDYIERSKHLRPVKKVLAAPLNLYTAGDVVWKIYAFENNKRKYRKAHPDWSEQLLEEFSAQLVLEETPNVAMADSDFLRTLRLLPVGSTFFSFTYLMYGVLGRQMKRCKSELLSDNRELNRIGLSRLIGLNAAMDITGAIGWFSIDAFIASLVGAEAPEDEEEKEDIWSLGYEWNIGKLFATEPPHITLDEKGQTSNVLLPTIPYSNFHAYGGVRDLVTAVSSGLHNDGSAKEVLTDVIGNMLGVGQEQFLSGNIVWETLGELQSNTDSYGRKIVAQTGPIQPGFLDVLFSKEGPAYVWKKLTPGFIAQHLREQRAADPNTPGWHPYKHSDAVSSNWGVTRHTIDVKKKVEYAARNARQNRYDAIGVILKGFGKTVTPEEAANLYDEGSLRLQAGQKTFNKVVGAAERRGLPGRVVDKVIHQANGGKGTPPKDYKRSDFTSAPLAFTTVGDRQAEVFLKQPESLLGAVRQAASQTDTSLSETQYLLTMMGRRVDNKPAKEALVAAKILRERGESPKYSNMKNILSEPARAAARKAFRQR